jgi:hypothetical protein
MLTIRQFDPPKILLNPARVDGCCLPRGLPREWPATRGATRKMMDTDGICFIVTRLFS